MRSLIHRLFLIAMLLIAGNVVADEPSLTPVTVPDDSDTIRSTDSFGNNYISTYAAIKADIGGGSGGAISTFTVCASDKTASYTCDYTADGTNDEVQIQAAVDAATALTYGGKVFLTEGHFNISASIVPKPNVWLEGAGTYQTWLLGQSGLANTAIIQDEVTYTSADPLLNFVVINMAFDGTAMTRVGYSTGRKAIFIKFVKRNIYRDLYMYNTPATCFGVDFFYDGIIDHLIADSCGTAGQGVNGGSNGLGIGTKGTAGAEDEKLFIVNNIAVNIANKGIMLEEQSGANSPRHIIMSNNLSKGNTDGFSISGTRRITFTGNQGWDNTAYGLFFDNDSGFGSVTPTETIIANNSFIDNTLDGISFGSGMESSINAIVANNIVYSNDGYGIAAKGTHLDITGNMVADNGLTGIFVNIGATAKNINIKMNNIHNNGILGTVGSNDGVKVSVSNGATATGINISNNSIVDTQGSPTQRYGIYLTTSTGTMNGVALLSNYMFGNTAGDILNDNVSASQITTLATKSGNVGIGTFLPKNTLDINGTTISTKVGIGTHTPSSQLAIQSSSTAAYTTNLSSASTNRINIENSSATANNYGDIRWMNYNGSAYVTGASLAGVHNSHTGGSESTSLKFLTRNAGTLGEKMTLEFNGNLGLGTVTPGAMLDISDGIRSVKGAAVGVGACWCTTPPKVLGNCTGALGTCSACNYNGSGC